jgi:ketosteroid isomerase-like protein
MRALSRGSALLLTRGASGSRPRQPWPWSTILINFPELRIRLVGANSATREGLRDTPTRMTGEKVDVAKRAIDAFNRRDFDGALAELLTPDFELYPGTVWTIDGGRYRGREGVERFKVDTAENWEELQSIPEEFRDLGDRVLMLGRFRGRGKGSGAPVDQPYAAIFDFRGDRIWRNRVYLDRAEGLRAAGLSE